LRVVPDRNVAIALLTNGGNPFELYTEIYGRLLQELAGVTMPPLPRPPAEPERVDATRYVGTYSCDVADFVVSQDDDGRVWLEQVPKGILAELGGEPERSELVHLEGDTFIPLEPQHGVHLPQIFLGDDGHGRAQYIHSGRATKRVASP
ncbi:MAG TPA: serine hydrolase, partial [Micromonosporaceae bacterium]